MATSGTTAFALDLTEIVEEAFERCGGEARTGYDLRTARRSLNLLFADWANRGVNLWTIDQQSEPLVDGTATYTLDADTVDLIEMYLRTNDGDADQQDLPLNRLGVSTYASLTNKNQEGRPLQVYVDRSRDAPEVTFWPVPDATSTYDFVYWRLRRIEDAGTGVETQDVPYRMLPALIAGLAYYLALKVPGALERLDTLKAQYDEAWSLASEEDRDRASAFFIPRVARV